MKKSKKNARRGTKKAWNSANTSTKKTRNSANGNTKNQKMKRNVGTKNPNTKPNAGRKNQKATVNSKDFCGRDMTLRHMKASVLGLLVAVVAVLTLPCAAQATMCGYSNIDGDHITAANDFQVRGISCTHAFAAATDYADSEAAGNTTVPGTERFTTQVSGWRYRWTCKTDEIRIGTYYHCNGRGGREGRRASGARMSFKWWLDSERECPIREFNSPFEFTSSKSDSKLVVSRLRSCAFAWQWIETALTRLHAASPYRTTTNGNGEKEWWYHYAPAEDRSYQCARRPFVSTANTEAEHWLCWEASLERLEAAPGAVSYELTVRGPPVSS